MPFSDGRAPATKPLGNASSKVPALTRPGQDRDDATRTVRQTRRQHSESAGTSERNPMADVCVREAMKCRCRALSVAAVLVPAGCSSGASLNGSATGGFASNVGVLGCAELVVWGGVEARDQVDEGLEVTFNVQEWVHPTSGGERVTFVADDPAVEVGAPEWDPPSKGFSS